ncbi:monooxygenase [Domibacillus mangrovi]|uniref:Dibenzothiophene monooxygenase n=2 Tax=Domibacillus mangrovi TaxID=1714354 RepID=A0A1Q5P0X5_9BACI|nr:monooxygenase [Domibacillus mangrovi]
MNIAKKINSTYIEKTKILIAAFDQTAVERDKRGGTAKKERDLIRESGLLALIIPTEFGGYGENWKTIFRITREFARVDGSIAHIFGYHFLCLVSTQLFGSQRQKEFLYKETAEKNLFWGNAYNPHDGRLMIKQADEAWLLQGEKSFCSGATDSDRLLISAKNVESNQTVLAVIPTGRKGVAAKGDWDGFGQRQTDSGTVRFQDVQLKETEILKHHLQYPDSVFPTIRTHIAQMILVHVLLGMAEGALEEAKHYTKHSSRAWPTSDAAEAAHDPYTVRQYGDLYVQLNASAALAEKAVDALQAAWEKEWSLTEQERGECSIAIATAKVMTARTALEVTNRIFDVMGAKSVSAKYRFDRYWRNIRTLTLHDPIEYKLRDIGDFVLNDQLPEITPYS